MTNGLFCIAVETICIAKNLMTAADQVFFVVPWEEFDRVGCGSRAIFMRHCACATVLLLHF